MNRIVRTLWGSSLQTALLLGRNHTILEHTSLNEKFGVGATTALPDGENPHLGYFCIGNGGHGMAIGTDNIPIGQTYDHRANDAACFKPMPFVLRAVDNDLTVDQRARFGLRVVMTISGKRYFAYWLRREDLSKIVVDLNYTKVVNSVETTTPYVPDSSGLTPKQPVIPSTGIVTTSGDYLSCSALMSIMFSEWDIAEYVAAARIMYGSDKYAIVSEIGLCSGYDITTTGKDGNNNNFNYKEAIGVQVATFITTMFDFSSINEAFEYDVDIGAEEPLLAEGTTATTV